jgi:drug/metabolite transporter (DMT)-like permease
MVINWSQPSTWRGVVMGLCGVVALGLGLPVIRELLAATSVDQISMAAAKGAALASLFSVIGQSVSGLIGTLFSDPTAPPPPPSPPPRETP